MILPPSQVWRQTAPNSKAFKLLSKKNGLLALLLLLLGKPVLPREHAPAKVLWDTRQTRQAVSGLKIPFCFPLPHGRPNTVVSPAATVSVRCARHRCSAPGSTCASSQGSTTSPQGPGEGQGEGRAQRKQSSYFVHHFISLMLFYFTALLLSGEA